MEFAGVPPVGKSCLISRCVTALNASPRKVHYTE